MNIDEILNHYEKNREKEAFLLEERKEKIYLENPKIKKIEDKINQLDNERIQSILNLSSNSENNDITREIKKLEKLKQEEIKKLKLPKDYFELKYICETCKDTGFVKIKGKTVKCNCVKQLLLDDRYNKSNLNLNEENFENFNLKYYSDKREENELSPRENVKEILKIAKDFVKNFNKDENVNKNLLFCGQTGLGKTFLSNAIANEILKKGYTIFYQTAPTMLDQLVLKKYQNTDEYFDMINYINNVDLLIIDDFGAENLSESKMKELFSMINNRLLTKKSTLISTNLGLDDIVNLYDDRISSRIIGNYIIKRFYGEDIRIIKKQNSKKK